MRQRVAQGTGRPLPTVGGGRQAGLIHFKGRELTGIESEPEVENPVAFPELSDAQLARLSSYGTPQTVDAGDVLYGPGDTTYDLVVLEDATVEIVQPATGTPGGVSRDSAPVRFSASSTS